MNGNKVYYKFWPLNFQVKVAFYDIFFDWNTENGTLLYSVHMKRSKFKNVLTLIDRSFLC